MSNEINATTNNSGNYIEINLEPDKLFGLQYPNPDKIANRTSTITRAMASTLAPIFYAKNQVELQHMAALLYYGKKFDELQDQEQNDCMCIVRGEKQVTCVYCGQQAKDLDHLFPLVEESKPSGYFTEPVNLVPCCSDCNESKGSKRWYEYMDISDYVLKLKTDAAKKCIRKYLEDDVCRYLAEDKGELKNILDSFREDENNKKTKIFKLISNIKKKNEGVLQKDTDELKAIVDQIIKKNIAREFLQEKLRSDVNAFVKNKDSVNNGLTKLLNEIKKNKKGNSQENAINRLLNDKLCDRKKNLESFCKFFGLPYDKSSNNELNTHKRVFIKDSDEDRWWKQLQKQINITLDIAQFQIDAFNAGAEKCHNVNYSDISEEQLVNAFKEHIIISLRKPRNDKSNKILHEIGINESELLKISSKNAKIEFIEGLEAYILGFKYQKGLKH